MYPQSRKCQRAIPEHNFRNSKKIVTAEFEIPVWPYSNAVGVKPDAIKVSARNVQGRSINDEFTPCMLIRTGVGEDNWTLDANFKRKKTSSRFTLIRGTIHFRSKYFGSWEPFEFMKHFVVKNLVENSPETAGKLVESIFTAEQLEATLALYKKQADSNFTGKFVLEMTLTVERISFSDKEERLLNAQEIQMTNALIPIPPKSDFCIKVGDKEFFVHLNQIKAFSCVSEALLKYVAKSDWSDLLNLDSMQALLRFIYYCEVDMISTPKITFELMKFGHMYLVPNLFRICGEKLMSLDSDVFSLAELFDIYMFARIPDEFPLFQELKRHFRHMLYLNACTYDTTELQQLAKRNVDLSGVDALVEILQFVDEDEPVAASAPKRPRT